MFVVPHTVGFIQTISYGPGVLIVQLIEWKIWYISPHYSHVGYACPSYDSSLINQARHKRIIILKSINRDLGHLTYTSTNL